MMKPKESELRLTLSDIFRKMAASFVDAISSVWAFLFFFIAILIWFLVGILFGFTETLQMFLHNTLNIVTLFIVLLIQHNKYRDNRSMHIKLDELLNGVEGSRNAFINIQKEFDKDLDKLEDEVVVNKTDDIDSTSKAQKRQSTKQKIVSANKLSTTSKVK